MDHELETERRHIQAELFMNQATGGQDQNDPPPPPLPVHQQQAPAQVVNSSNPG